MLSNGYVNTEKILKQNTFGRVCMLPISLGLQSSSNSDSYLGPV